MKMSAMPVDTSPGRSRARRLIGWARTPAAIKALKVTVSMVGFLVVWEICVIAFNTPAYLLPAPSLIISTIGDRFPLFVNHGGITFFETLAGFAIAVLFGVLIAAIIVVIPVLADFIMPILLVSQLVPKVAIAPLLLIWFGYGLFPKILIAFLIAFFPIVVNTAYGFASVDPAMLDLARSLNATRWQIFFKFRVPTAMPYLLGGAKIAITLAVIGAVIGEFVGGSEGLGYLIIIANSELDTALGFSALVILSLGGIAMYMAVEACERLLIPWNRDSGPNVDFRA